MTHTAHSTHTKHITTHVCMHACVCMHTRVHTCTCAHVHCVGVCMFVCPCVHSRVHACVCGHVRVHVHVHVSACVCARLPHQAVGALVWAWSVHWVIGAVSTAAFEREGPWMGGGVQTPGTPPSLTRLPTLLPSECRSVTLPRTAKDNWVTAKSEFFPGRKFKCLSLQLQAETILNWSHRAGTRCRGPLPGPARVGGALGGARRDPNPQSPIVVREAPRHGQQPRVG